LGEILGDEETNLGEAKLGAEAESILVEEEEILVGKGEAREEAVEEGWRNREEVELRRVELRERASRNEGTGAVEGRMGV
jgi:hypothetical protein